MNVFSKILAISFLLTLSFACKEQKKIKQSVETKSITQIDCIPYFAFDRIEHYYLDIAENAIWDLENKKSLSEKEKKKLKILLQQTPDKLSDSIILKDLERIGFVKEEISYGKFEKINEIFCKRKHKEVWSTRCIAVFRDILVFRKEGKTIGIAKLCFTCNQSVITGTALDTDEFGQSGDYEKLYKLLY